MHPTTRQPSLWFLLNTPFKNLHKIIMNNQIRETKNINRSLENQFEWI